MPKYHASDDGKTIDGNIIIWLKPPGLDVAKEEQATPASSADGVPSSRRAEPPRTPEQRKAESVATAKATAATLKAAAGSGVPFCAECERRGKLREGKT